MNTSLKYKINNDIRAPIVVVINESGENLGQMPTFKAVGIAEEASLDLVEVSPLAKPPVCKILDYNQFKYKEQQKLKASQKQANKIVIKGIKLSPNIGKHDLDTKTNQSKKFFDKGYKIRVELQLRGRETKYIDLSKELINNFIESLEMEKDKKNVIVEDPIKFKNNKLTCTISYKK